MKRWQHIEITTEQGLLVWLYLRVGSYVCGSRLEGDFYHVVIRVNVIPVQSLKTTILIGIWTVMMVIMNSTLVRILLGIVLEVTRAPLWKITCLYFVQALIFLWEAEYFCWVAYLLWGSISHRQNSITILDTFIHIYSENWNTEQVRKMQKTCSVSRKEHR
jgi:hypothetical protein